MHVQREAALLAPTRTCTIASLGSHTQTPPGTAVRAQATALCCRGGASVGCATLGHPKPLVVITRALDGLHRAEDTTSSQYQTFVNGVVAALKAQLPAGSDAEIDGAVSVTIPAPASSGSSGYGRRSLLQSPTATANVKLTSPAGARVIVCACCCCEACLPALDRASEQPVRSV